MLITRLINEFYVFFVSDIVVECSRNSILYFNVYFMPLSLNAHKMIVKRKRETFIEAEKRETRKNKKNMINSEPTLLRMLYNKCITDNIATTIT